MEKDVKKDRKTEKTSLKGIGGIVFTIVVLFALLLIFLYYKAIFSQSEIPEEQVPALESTLNQEKGIITEETEESGFEIHYIDVGQGDSALVLCEGDVMLIDGGTSNNARLIYSYLQKQGVEKIDYLVASHPHDDHIGGLAGALNYAKVERVLCSANTYDSTSFADFAKYVEKQGLKIEVPNVGEHFTVGSAQVEILGVGILEETNGSSIILKITYGDTSFLFTGDACAETEQALLASGCDLQSTVLKVAHHGSAEGTTEEFLRAVMPRYAIISVGNYNTYGHPAEETIEKLKYALITTFRTDLQGDIVCESDGRDVFIRVERNANKDTLELVSGIRGFMGEDASEEASEEVSEEPETCKTSYVLNKNTRKFHYETCESVQKMKEKNKEYFTGTREECVGMGYDACGNCKP